MKFQSVKRRFTKIYCHRTVCLVMNLNKNWEKIVFRQFIFCLFSVNLLVLVIASIFPRFLRMVSGQENMERSQSEQKTDIEMKR